MNENEMAEWVHESLQGNPRAFETLYHATNQRVWFLCLHFLKNEQDALDVMQDTYLTAYKNLSNLQNPNSFYHWLMQIAANKCRNYIKANRPVPVEDEMLEGIMTEDREFTLPEEYVTNKERRQIVMNIMQNHLSEVQYQTVLMYYFNNMNIPEIAAVMECPEGTVKYRLSVARDKIKSGVMQYEQIHDTKLYSFAGVPILSLLLAEEVKGYQVPQAAEGIVSAIYGITGVGSEAGAKGAGTADGTTGTDMKGGMDMKNLEENAIGNTTENTTGNATGNATGNQSIAASTADKAGAASTAGKAVAVSAAGKSGGIFASLGVKIAVAVAVTAIVGGLVAVVVVHQKKDDKNPTGTEYASTDNNGNSDKSDNSADIDNGTPDTVYADGIITKENQAAYTEDMRGYIDDQGNYVNEYFGFTTYYAGQGWDLQIFEEYYYNLYGIEKTFLESIEESTARALYAQHWDDGAMDRGEMYYDCYDLLHDMDEVTPTEEWYQEYMLDTLRKYREQNVTCKYSLYNACIDGIPCYYMECEIHSDPSSGETLYGAPHHLVMIYVFKDNMYLKIDVVPSYCSYNYEEVFGNQLKLLHMSDFAPIDMDDIEKPNEVDQGM